MKNIKNMQKGNTLIITIVLLAVLFVSGGVYMYTHFIGVPHSEIITPQESPATTTPIPPTIRSEDRAVFTDSTYGFSFSYPTKNNTSVKTITPTTEYGPVQKAYSFTYNENSDMQVYVIAKKDFRARTKIGEFTLSNQCFIDSYSNTPQQLTAEKYGTHTAYKVGGSQMSSPAHYEYAVITNSNYVLIFAATYENSLEDKAISATISSLTFNRNTKSVSIQCP